MKPRPSAGRADAPESTVELRVHEQFEGRGKVYDGARFLAEVHYKFKGVQEVYQAVALGDAPAEQVVGARNVFGVVQSPTARALGGYVGARLTLELQDGSLLDFTVTKVLRADVFLSQGLGGVRRAGT